MELKTKADNFWQFYLNNPEKFEERINPLKKYGNYAFLAVCVLLIIFPGVIPTSPWIVRIASIIGLIYFGFSALTGGREMYSKASNGKLTNLLVKKFDMDNCDESDIINAFYAQDFDALADFPEADNQPIQLYVEVDKAGKELYCVIKKYYSSSDFRHATDVIVLSGTDYDKWIGVIKSMK